MVKGPFRVNESEKPYGPWLRVPSPRRRREFFSSPVAEEKGTGSGFGRHRDSIRTGEMVP
jgi:hypothetical protein